MAEEDEPAKVPVLGIVVALLWLVFLSVVCLGTLVTIWPHPTPAGTTPVTETVTDTATTDAATSTQQAAAPAPPPATGTPGPTGRRTSTPSTRRWPPPCDDPEFKKQCDCVDRVAVMQGLYYTEPDKPQELKNDPACVYFWVPFNLFGLTGWHILWGETRLLLIVMLCGFLGAMIYSLRSFFWYTGHRALVWSWLAMYLVVPIVGSMMAIVFYLVFRGGLFNPSGTVSDTSPFGFAAISALVGMFTQQSAMKLKAVFETLLSKGEQGENAVQPTPPAKPVITDIEPKDPKSGTDVPLKIVGKELRNGTPFAGTTALTITASDATSLTATLPKELIPAAGTKLDITVQTTAGTSNAVPVTAS